MWSGAALLKESLIQPSLQADISRLPKRLAWALASRRTQFSVPLGTTTLFHYQPVPNLAPYCPISSALKARIPPRAWPWPWGFFLHLRAVRKPP